jgi:hypothetical protein
LCFGRMGEGDKVAGDGKGRRTWLGTGWIWVMSVWLLYSALDDRDDSTAANVCSVRIVKSSFMT